MNVLPLILALILVLSVLTIEKFEKFKNQIIVHKQYQLFLKEGEREMFNLRQRHLLKGQSKHKDKTHRQISFAYLIKKNVRGEDLNKAKQYRLLILDLMKTVYAEATFFKEVEKKRPQFLEELLEAIEKAADKPPYFIKRIEDIACLDLGDPELQNVFYHMLKGTIPRDKLKKLADPSSVKEKAYPSLFSFIHDGQQQIMVQRCSKEVLKAIFLDDAVVNDICAKRQEFSMIKGRNSNLTQEFADAFQEKRRQGIDTSILNFSISGSDKTNYD